MKTMFMTLIFGTLLTYTFKTLDNISYLYPVIMSIAWAIGDVIYSKLTYKSNKIQGDTNE